MEPPRVGGPSQEQSTQPHAHQADLQRSPDMRPLLWVQEWVAVQIKKEVRLKELEAKAAALEQGQEVGGTGKQSGVCMLPGKGCRTGWAAAVWCKVSLHITR